MVKLPIFIMRYFRVNPRYEAATNIIRKCPRKHTDKRKTNPPPIPALPKPPECSMTLLTREQVAVS